MLNYLLAKQSKKNDNIKDLKKKIYPKLVNY